MGIPPWGMPPWGFPLRFVFRFLSKLVAVQEIRNEKQQRLGMKFEI